VGSRKKFEGISPAFKPRSAVEHVVNPPIFANPVRQKLLDRITGRRKPISIFGAVMIAAISASSSLVAAQEMPEFLNIHLDNVPLLKNEWVRLKFWPAPVH
jgi:hypothetical protein